MSHDIDATCLCMLTHRPAPLEYVEHHIWPLGMGGPNTLENRVWLCPTTHMNVHELLRQMVRDDTLIGYLTFCEIYTVPVSRYAYLVAAEGFRRWKEHNDLPAV